MPDVWTASLDQMPSTSLLMCGHVMARVATRSVLAYAVCFKTFRSEYHVFEICYFCPAVVLYFSHNISVSDRNFIQICLGRASAK